MVKEFFGTDFTDFHCFFPLIHPCLSKRAVLIRAFKLMIKDPDLSSIKAQPPGLARKWNPQASGLAPKYSRLRLYFGA